LGHDARNAGCSSWQEYAALRRQESLAALTAAGANRAAIFHLDCPDQEAVFRIDESVYQLSAIFDEIRPELVLTHPYEGGHPDHDAAAAAVHAVAWRRNRDFRVFEFASYHAGVCGMACECFADNRTVVLERPLAEEESRWKRQVLDCHASQANVLRQFPLKNEPLRAAPEYDFAAAPHSGGLYYERFGWSLTPSTWRVHAQSAFRRLEVPCVC
jgi:N-acetylglucosamine malate deacetylase 2